MHEALETFQAERELGASRATVSALDPPRSMIWGTPGQTTWSWSLDPLPGGGTRLVTRVRAVYRWMSPTIVFGMLIEFADIWMIRKMLMNVKARAEALERSELATGRVAMDRQ